MDPLEKQKVLTELGIDEGMYNELLRDLQVHVREKLSMLQEGVRSADYDALASIAHSIKGASANLWVHSLRSIAEKIEKEAKGTKDIAVIASYVAQMDTALQSFVAECNG
jgi:HPt (histidine-containing phosphotransfer) domain-containing protein